VKGRRRLRLRLYIAGSGPNSAQARANLRQLLEERCVEAELDVVDIFEEPDRALEDGVLVTPTLVRLAPEPVQRVVGNLSEGAAVLGLLELPEAV